MIPNKDLEKRLFAFPLRIIRLFQRLETLSDLGRIVGKQILRAGTAIGANYQEAQAGQSRKDFISKTSIALKEAREALYWLRLIIAAKIVPDDLLTNLADEAEQLTKILGAIVVRSKKKAKTTTNN